MNEQLIWPCVGAVILTIIALWEAIRDFRAVRNDGNDQNRKFATTHSVVIESVRVFKVLTLSVGVAIAAMFQDRVWAVPARSWIMMGVATLMGATSLADLLFRHWMMKRLKAKKTK
jgi:hypothetical protein